MTDDRRTDSRCREIVQVALAHLVAHHADPRLTREQIADAAHVSVRQLSRAFAQAGIGTVASVLADLRLRTAADLLARTTMTVSEVATRAGFGGVHALRRHCRNVLGCSPTALRLARHDQPWPGQRGAEGFPDPPPSPRIPRDPLCGSDRLSPTRDQGVKSCPELVAQPR